MAHANRHHCILSLRSDARTRHQRRYRSHRPVLRRSLWSSASYHFGGVLSDCWPLAQRGIAMALAVSLVFSGPTWGPVCGGFIMGSPSLGWRWTMWVVVIIGLGFTLLCVFLYPETYPPVILRAKVQALRRKNGNLNIRTALDKGGLSIQNIMSVYLVRPFCEVSYFPIFKDFTEHRCDSLEKNKRKSIH